MTYEHVAAELERCDRAIAEMEQQPEGEKAYLTTLGIEDWRAERRILLRMQTDPAMTDAVAAEAELGKLSLRPDPRRPGGHINPSTGIPPVAEWGRGCIRGHVSNERFARPGDQVIPNRRRRTA